MNHPNHPRAPMIWQFQRHRLSQYIMLDRWNPPESPALYDGLPPEAGEPAKGHGVQSEQMIIGTHMGAHVDAGVHFDHREDAQDAASIPLERCCGDAILLDLRDECEDHYAITIADLEAAESRASEQVREGDIVLLNTGNAERHAYGPVPDVEKYAWNGPGLAPETPPWFIERKVKAVGIDTPNLDSGLTGSECHVNFLMRGWIGKEVIQIFENLAYLERIPQPRFTFFGLPLPIVGGSGSPIRAIAVIP